MLIHMSTIESGPPAIRAGRHEGATLRAGYDAFFDAAAGLAGSAPPSNDGRGLHRGSRKVMVPAGGGLAAGRGLASAARASHPSAAPSFPTYTGSSPYLVRRHRSASRRARCRATLRIATVWPAVNGFSDDTVHDPIQLVSAQIGRVTGKGIIANVKDFAPRWLVIALVSMLVTANTFNIAADLAAMGEALSLVIGGLNHEHALIFAETSVLLQVFVRYRR
jgi:hypothetical protein